MDKISKELPHPKKLYAAKRGDFELTPEEYKKNWSALHFLCNERIFTVGETKIPYRVISHWDAVKILPNLKRGSGWRKFSFIELVWIKIVQRLREFGFSLSKIEKARESILDSNYLLDGDRYPVLEFYVAQAQITNANPYAAFLQDGSVEIGSLMEITHSRKSLANQDFILISLKSALEEIGFNVPESELLFSLNAGEVEMLKAVRLEGNKEIKATLTPSGKVKEIETAKVYADPSSIPEINQTLKNEEGFADLNIRYVKGKKRSVEVRKRRKLI